MIDRSQRIVARYHAIAMVLPLQKDQTQMAFQPQVTYRDSSRLHDWPERTSPSLSPYQMLDFSSLQTELVNGVHLFSINISIPFSKNSSSLCFLFSSQENDTWNLSYWLCNPKWCNYSLLVLGSLSKPHRSIVWRNPLEEETIFPHFEDS